jgi:hypothetical protein
MVVLWSSRDEGASDRSQTREGQLEEGVEVMNDMVMIDRAELRSLQRDRVMLEALEAIGVDNWEGWSDSLDLARQWNKDRFGSED